MACLDLRMDSVRFKASRASRPSTSFRGNLFDRLEMRMLPANVPGPDNDLSDQVEHFVDRAIQESDACRLCVRTKVGTGGNDEGQDI